MTCPLCNGKVNNMVFLIVCAACKMAWTGLEFQIAWDAMLREGRDNA